MPTSLVPPRKTTCLAPPPGGKERRAAVRYRCRLDCQCNVITLARRGKPWRAHVQDISASGLRLLLGSPVPLGRFLAIGIQSPHGECRQVRARVMRISRIPQTRCWDVGCSFASQLSEEELAEFVA